MEDITTKAADCQTAETDTATTDTAKKKNITTFQEVLTTAKELAKYDFSVRDFELDMSNTEAFIVLTDELEQQMTNYVDQYNQEDNATCYVLFLLLFTAYRRKKMGNLEGFTNKYLCMFRQYPFSDFIELLMLYNIKKDDDHLHEMLIRSKRLSESKGINYDFTTHHGVLNLYVEVVCTYFELNLDKRGEAKNSYIKDAVEKIKTVILAEEAKEGQGKAYSKFYLNRGRLEVLLGNYDVGEEYIIKAIHSIGPGANRAYIVHEYELYLTKRDMIRLYDLNNVKIKEVEKVKIDNVKSLSLMTALLGFLLGAINIFSSITDLKALAVLMVTYCGLVLTLLGALLLGIKLLYNEKNRRFGVYNLLIFASGIIIFGASILLLLI